MKKAGVFLIILILFSVSVSAFGLSDILKLFSGSEPVVINTQANPIKVYPGQSLQNLVAFEDRCGIESATAYFPYEGGYDKVEMILSAGDAKKGTYSASWVVHDTANMKWYKTKVVLVSACGGQTLAYVDWQDPTQDHPAEQISGGTFPDNYTFAGYINMGATLDPLYKVYLKDDSANALIFSWSNKTSGTSYGVYGRSDTPNGRGVYGFATGAGGAGIVGTGGASGYAATFSGGLGILSSQNISVGTYQDYVYHSSNCVRVSNYHSVDCPSGTTVVSGGFDCSNDLSASDHYSQPKGDLSGWDCDCGSGSDICWAVCCG